MEQTSYTFKYDGDLEYIDVKTLISSQLSFMNLLNEVQLNLYPESDIRIKVKYLPKGSWQYEFLIAFLPGMFTPVNAGKLKLILEAVKGVIDIKKLFGGEKTVEIKQESGNITIKNNRGQITVNQSVYNLAKSNVKIDKSINDMIDVVNNDKDIKGIEILDDKKNKVVEIKKENFGEVSNTNPLLERPDTKQEIKKNVSLHVVKVNFEQGYKWDFYYEGNKIPAKFNDIDYFSQVSEGQEAFKAGDVLFVDLAINKVYEKRGDTYINSSYSIEKVHKHFPRGEQSKMDFNG